MDISYEDKLKLYLLKISIVSPFELWFIENKIYWTKSKSIKQKTAFINILVESYYFHPENLAKTLHVCVCIRVSKATERPVNHILIYRIAISQSSRNATILLLIFQPLFL